MSKADAVAAAEARGLDKDGTEEEIMARVAAHDQAEEIRAGVDSLLTTESDGTDRVQTLLDQAYKIESVREVLMARRTANRLAVRNLYDTGILNAEEKAYVDAVYPFTSRAPKSETEGEEPAAAANGNGEPAATPEPAAATE